MLMEAALKRGARDLARSMVRRLPNRVVESAGFQRDVSRRRLAASLGYDFPLAVWSDDWLTYSMARTGSYELTQKHFLAQSVFPRLDPLGVAVDVGSNVGTYSLFLARHFDRVFAFDPSEDACQLLAVSLHGNSIKNVQVTNAALGAEPSSVLLVIPEEEVANRGGARLIPLDVSLGEGPAGSLVEVVVGDAALSDASPVSYIKIDVEGAEADVLRGLHGTLERERPVISVEVLDLAAKSRVESILNDLGYTGLALVRSRRARNVVPLSEVADLSGLSLVHFLPVSLAEGLIGTGVRELG